ncbi:MAG: tyrosine-type recombinase/integrase [Myxococcales bacterium]|nr:tyrosine-type recombinase/integrase [Myxococcales bacterium]
MARITKRTVDAQKPPAKGDRIVWDDELRGFGLRVYASGRRTYLIQYRAKGRTRRYVIGVHGVLTPAAARERAARLLLAVKDGRDPSEERLEASREPTVAELAVRYFRDYAEPRKKPRSVAGDRWFLDRHILPALGKRRVSDVMTGDVRRLHASLADRPILANRVRALLSTLFNLAEEWGVRPPNSSPVKGVKRNREPRRQRFLSPAEIGRLGDVLRAVHREHPRLRTAVAAIRFALLTGMRRGEVEGLTWSEVNLGAASVELTDSKTGKRRVYLNAPAVALLAGLERRGEFVFPNRTGDKRINLDPAWRKIRARADLEDVRFHDLRHSHASVGVGAGLAMPLLAKLMGHSSTAMTERYAHLADDPVKAASEAIGSRIAAALDADPLAPVFRVVARNE